MFLTTSYYKYFTVKLTDQDLEDCAMVYMSFRVSQTKQQHVCFEPIWWNTSIILALWG